MERQTLHDILVFLNQYGILHGLLAGLTALIRGAYEKEGFGKACFDALLCVIIGMFVLYIPGLEEMFKAHPTRAIIGAMVIGIIGANLIITTIRDSFTAAIKQLNPLNWFKKAK